MDIDAGKGWQKERMRLEAIKRAPTYIRLFDEALNAFLKTKCGPDVDLDVLRDNTEDRKEFLNSIPALLLAAQCNLPTLLDPQTEIPFEYAVPPPRSATVIHRQGEPTDSNTIANKHCILNTYDPKGRYLVIEVDLDRSLGDIRWYLELILKYNTFDKDGLQRIRGDAASPFCFKVYDKISAGSPALQVMYDEFPKTDGLQPTYDQDAKNCYEKIRRAQQKAQRLINQAEQTLQANLR
jgi:hypothetical protein